MRDVVALDQVLDECNDDLDAALPLFSSRQVKEGLALWSLLQLATSKNKFFTTLFGLVSFIRQFIQRLFKRWPQTMMSALSQGTKPYSEVERDNDMWVKFASFGKKKVVPMIATRK